MIPKSTLAKIVLKQRKGLEDRNSGQLRHMLPTMPYLTDRALLIGGVRGSGRSTLLLQMLENDYPQAWYTDFPMPDWQGLIQAILLNSQH